MFVASHFRLNPGASLIDVAVVLSFAPPSINSK